MKPYFYQHANFGDALNLWLWPKLIPAEFFDDDPASIFVGIGTLINNRLPLDPFKVVFGTGVGYGDPIPVVDDRWKIYCVRGPLSARAMKIDHGLAVTDAATLVRLIQVPDEPKQFDFSFVPHWQSSARWDWEAVCQANGIHFIDPLLNVETVFSEIKRTKVLLAEAMHGAIIADAFRVPWVPIVTNKEKRGDRAHWTGARGVFEFKWQDWCGSLGMDYRPVFIPRPEYRRGFVVSRLERRLSPQRLKNEVLSRVAIRAAALSSRAAEALINPVVTRRAAAALHSIAESCSPMMSSDSVINLATERLSERLDMLNTDVRRGVFSVVPGT